MAHIRSIRALSAVSVSCLVLSACSSVPVAVCPAIVEYGPEVQTKAADEMCMLVGEPAGCTAEQANRHPQPTLAKLITDYGVLRAKLRTCQS